VALSRIDNPPNPWRATAAEYIGPPPTQVFVGHSRTIISRDDSPDLPFRWRVNPYRGCFHGCAYRDVRDIDDAAAARTGRRGLRRPPARDAAAAGRAGAGPVMATGSIVPPDAMEAISR